MKKRLTIVLALLCILLAVCVPQFLRAAEPEAPAVTGGVVLYTNDVHCGVDDGMGYAGLATVKRALENAGEQVVLVDCGDAIQGAPIGMLSTGEYLIDIMNELGYSVAAVGNHEFDYGMERFLELKNKAKFAYVSCNFMDLKANAPVLNAYKIVDVGGVKAAFVGISTPKTITSSTPKNFQNEAGEFIYGFCQDETGEALYSAVQNAVDAARAEGADCVVAISHLGITADCSPWTSSEVIENTAGINAVLDGHSHSVVECEVVKNKNGENVLLSQTGTKLQSAGMLRIGADGKLSASLIEYASDVADFIGDIEGQYEEMLQTVVAKSGVDLEIMDPREKDARLIRRQETNLGDLCADAYRLTSGADIAFVNGGGIRKTINAGDITYESILNVHPYGNALCVVEATGQEILDALEMGCRALPEESGGFLQVSGLTCEVDTSVPSTVKLDANGIFEVVEGDRRVSNVKVGGEAIDPEKTYTLAGHDYMLLNFGDGYSVFADNVILQDRVMLDNQVLINYIVDRLGGAVGEEYADPYGQDRIIIK